MSSREISEIERQRRREYMREYRQKNLERIQAANREYYWAHREKQLAYAKKYREEHSSEKEKAARREYARAMYSAYKEKRILASLAKEC